MIRICAWASVLTPLALLACSTETETTDTADPSVPAADIGPEGGQLVGTIENGFPGVVLTIPEGALSEVVRVSFDGAFDATPLPTLAERVGPQVRVLPEGLSLAVPAELSLPIDDVLRLGYEDPDQDCKVWAREGDGWQRQEPKAAGDGRVTVELTKFTTAATGVVLAPKAPSCAVCGATPVLTEAPCQSSTGYCVTPVREPSIPIGAFETTAVVADEKLYFLQVDGSKVNPVELDLYTSSAALPLNSHTMTQSLNFRRMAVSGEGSAWLPIVNGGGLVKFKKNALPEHFDVGLQVEGVVAGSTDSDVTRVFGSTSGGKRALSVKNFSSSRTLASAPNFGSTQILPFGSGGRFFLTSSTNGVCQGQISDAKSSCEPTPDTSPLGGVTGGAIATSDTEAAVATASFSSSRTVSVLGPTGRGTPLRTYTTSSGVRAMAFGEDGKIYAISATAAEVMILSPAGGVSTLTLSSDDPGSASYIAMLPRAILTIPGRNELLLIVKGDANGQKRLFRIRQP